MSDVTYFLISFGEVVISSHSLLERIHALLEHGFARLKECALLGKLWWLCGDETDLLVSELGDDQWRKDSVGKRLDEVALNNLLGDSINKVLRLILLDYYLSVRNELGGYSCPVVCALIVQRLLGGVFVHVLLNRVSYSFLHLSRIVVGVAGIRVVDIYLGCALCTFYNLLVLALLLLLEGGGKIVVRPHFLNLLDGFLTALLMLLLLGPVPTLSVYLFSK
ncbi:uncharacterized protein BDZ99DRAFT_481240 [Mytilinidion resinicola]|uniref:Uncharacterized protein n=1 Tax=Mytilinidion resinicola TaxID=574789 RepID=A0A6A6Y746_9PEZI|nr:uncharacterized protein BDZ99DRAFT_481240 [Mytilinidion resinicola]KAF2804419.1 hypothetical protein BDZ99DRAFT_481240 [Mytilinidion resinicola]